VDALAKLQALYNQRDAITKQIDAIGELLGTKEEKVVKERKARGPNKPKQQPPKLPLAAI
jgi:hypothetical protein